MPKHLIRWILAAVTANCCSSVLAIEAPKTETPPAAGQVSPAAVAPSADDKVFYETLRRSTVSRSLSGLKVSDTVVLQLARGSADAAVATLSVAASQGGTQENIALVRIQHWCTSMT